MTPALNEKALNMTNSTFNKDIDLPSIHTTQNGDYGVRKMNLKK
eukprot:CAMPEP_0205812582 /NCGR_PEP_ID=MMETSP0205-20121125/17062_1 /ASSEMBLY_ACC=CAM_ASM_000278 /TAXON_ID=36767 /ORGANISM="Euplotes focardii, Strain TN1" /LENGTH=43 /DNA_ID= /DNA_START= /DNA_END= /DNA_ORIENTATION=